jgi:integrase
MRWAEIDFTEKLWTIPATRMKNATEHLVPLSEPVIEILKGLPRRGEFVFTGNGRSAIANFSHMKAQLDEALPVDGLFMTCAEARGPALAAFTCRTP